MFVSLRPLSSIAESVRALVLLVIVVMMALMGDLSVGLLVFDCALAATVTSGFYLFVSYAVAGAVRSWEKRLSMRLDDFPRLLAGPHDAFLLLAAMGIGMGLPLVLLFIDFNLLLRPGPNVALIAGAWTAATVASILPRVGTTWSSSAKLGVACLSGAVAIIVLFMWCLGSDVLLVWLIIAKGYFVLLSFGIGSALGAVGGLALARELRPMLN